MEPPARPVLDSTSGWTPPATVAGLEGTQPWMRRVRALLSGPRRGAAAAANCAVPSDSFHYSSKNILFVITKHLQGSS